MPAAEPAVLARGPAAARVGARDRHVGGERESERAAGFSLLSSQLADLGSLMSGILGRTDADVAAAFPEPETVSADDGNAPELDAPSPAGDLATRLADLDETVSRVGTTEKEEDLPKDLVEQEAAAGTRGRRKEHKLSSRSEREIPRIEFSQAPVWCSPRRHLGSEMGRKRPFRET